MAPRLTPEEKESRRLSKLIHHEQCLYALLPIERGDAPLVCSCPPEWPRSKKGVVAPSGAPKIKSAQKKASAPKEAKLPNPCLGASREPCEISTNHYALRTDFAPSNAQMVRYCEYHKYKMVMEYDHETGKSSPCFDKNALPKLIERYPKDPLFPLIAEYREVERCLGTNVDGLNVVDGRVHSEFGHLPKTGRLSSKNPNMQNIPRKADEKSWYFKIREMYTASEGCRLLECDFGGIEGVLTMYLAGVNNDGTAKLGTEDARLGLRLTGIDIHGFISSYDIGQPADPKWSDVDLKEYLGAFRKENRKWATKSGLLRSYEEIRDCNKTGLYASLYVGGPGTLVRSRPDVFPNEAVAAAVQELIFGLFPSVPKWWWEVCHEAEKFGYITTPDGYRQWFSDVLYRTYIEKERRWSELKMTPNRSNECVAAKPQHLAMCFTGQGLDLFWEKYPQYRDGLRLTIHDSIVGEWPDEIIRDVYAALKECMETPLPFLPLPPEFGLGTHLKVGVEGKWSVVGGNWREMEKIRL